MNTEQYIYYIYVLLFVYTNTVVHYLFMQFIYQC